MKIGTQISENVCREKNILGKIHENIKTERKLASKWLRI